AEARLQAGRLAARRAFLARTARALAELEQTADTYVQLWRGLGRLGIKQIAALGEQIDSAELDPSRHELVGSNGARRYIVRSAGVEIDGEVIRRARLEASD